MNIANRLQKLEQGIAGDVCPGCGCDKSAPVRLLPIVLDDDAQPVTTQTCRVCGWPPTFHPITFDGPVNPKPPADPAKDNDHEHFDDC